jgi:hypothetical protein
MLDERTLQLIEKFIQCDDDQVTDFEMRIDNSMAIIKFILNRQLYLFMNGRLIYKRWIDTLQFAVFDVFTYDKHTYTSIIETTKKHEPK